MGFVQELIVVRFCEAIGVDGGIITCVGAGGKTSLVKSLGVEWQERKLPFLLTTTTKMFLHEVVDFAPVICDQYDQGIGYINKYLRECGYAGLFKNLQNEKVGGIPPEWVDEIYDSGLVNRIIVEGDGANRKILKAPKDYEPVIPSKCRTVIGVLALKSIGQAFDASIVHRLETVAGLLNKKVGEPIKAEDLAVLAVDERGIFKNYQGRKIVLLAAGTNEDVELADEVIEDIKRRGNEISSFVVTSGYGKDMKPVKVVS